MPHRFFLATILSAIQRVCIRFLPAAQQPIAAPTRKTSRCAIESALGVFTGAILNINGITYSPGTESVCLDARHGKLAIDPEAHMWGHTDISIFDSHVLPARLGPSGNSALACRSPHCCSCGDLPCRSLSIQEH